MTLETAADVICVVRETTDIVKSIDLDRLTQLDVDKTGKAKNWTAQAVVLVQNSTDIRNELMSDEDFIKAVQEAEDEANEIVDKVSGISLVFTRWHHRCQGFSYLTPFF